GIGPPAFGPRGLPIVRRCFAPAERRQESQLHRFAFRTEIAPGQQKGFARPGAEVRETQRGGQWFWFASFSGLECVLQRVPFPEFFSRNELPEILAFDAE